MRFTEFTGTARLDRRTKQLVKRLCPDDIAIIDHTDLDRVSAEELAESGVRIVFNVADSARAGTRIQARSHWYARVLS